MTEFTPFQRYLQGLVGIGRIGRPIGPRIRAEGGICSSGAAMGDPGFVRAAARLAELAPKVGDTWRSLVAMSFIEHCPKDETWGMHIRCPRRACDLSTARDHPGGPR